MRKQRIIYYSDELNDDFAATHNKIAAREVKGDYRYRHDRNPIWRFGEFVLYRLLATPIAALYMYVGRGLRVKGRRNLKGLKGGYFLYGNHTQMGGDAFTPTMISFPKRTNILVHPDIVSIPVARTLVRFMGAIPVPTDRAAARNMLHAMKAALEAGEVVTVYPEAHIWPWYNGIRHFSEASFAYPFLFHVPAVGFTVTHRRRRILRFLPPAATVTISKPFFPQSFENKTEMRDTVYNFMTDCAEKEKSYAYVQYIRKENAENEDHRCL